MISLEAKRYLFIYLSIYLDRTLLLTEFALCSHNIPQCDPNNWKYKCLVRDGNNQYYVSCEIDNINMVIPCNTLINKYAALVCCQPRCP